MQNGLRRWLGVVVTSWVYASLSYAQVNLGSQATVHQPSPTVAQGSNGKLQAGAMNAPLNGKLIDLNNATRTELKSLPGIDEGLAKKIIAGRPYASKADLVSHGIVLAGPYQSIKKYIMAGQVKKPGEAEVLKKQSPSPG